jgi:hypothetical protein
MRLKAEIWVKAYLRRCTVDGVSAVVVRHGDDDAGAIFIRVNRLDGTSLLYGPAPAGLEGAEQDRRWIAHFAAPGVADDKVDAHLAREYDYDRDLWLIEVEDRAGRSFLEDWLAPAS